MKPIVELWTPVLINDGIFKDDYLVSNMGRVKQKCSNKDGSCHYKLLRIINTERPIVKIQGNGKLYSKSVAKLVLSSFHYREGCECANITYLDGNMKNCELSNLRYAVDASVYLAIREKNRKAKAKRLPKRKLTPVKPIDKTTIKSCSTCKKNPCFSGMENFTTDFGAEGCRKYKSRDED